MTPPTASSQRWVGWTQRATAAVFLAVWLYLGHPPMLEDLHHRWKSSLLVAAIAFGVAFAASKTRFGLDRLIAAVPRWAFVTFVCAVGVALTVYFQRGPMKGIVISRDASVYILQARALTHFSFGAPIPVPRFAFGAHFLFQGADGLMHTVFAPGYPLFLAPFVALGIPMLAGPATGVLLVLSQDSLVRRVQSDEIVSRVSLLIPLASFGRLSETGDLLSHAFVAALAAWAVSLALAMGSDPTRWRAVMLGVCVGWLASSRMLDGFVVAAFVGLVLVVALVRRRLAIRTAALVVAGALPFVLFVAAQQRAATGHWSRPTSVEYVTRADYPPTCLRLGFGRDVGCTVEHASVRETFGADGYTPDDALRIVRSRTSVLGRDLFSFSPAIVLAFVGVVVAPTLPLLLCAAFPVALTLVYGLFYYGNAPVFGARHVFPAAPFLYVLCAAAIAALARRRPASTAVGAAPLLAVVIAAAPVQWRFGFSDTRIIQREHYDVRGEMRRANVTRGIVTVTDLTAYIASYDPWRDAPHRHLALNDWAGLIDLRRAYPDLPLYLQLAERPLMRSGSPAPAPGIHVELARAWPSFVHVAGLGVGVIQTEECCQIQSSGRHVLFLFEARPGSRMWFTFDVLHTGRYALHVGAMRAPDYGDYEIRIDGEPLTTWRGYAPQAELRQGEVSAPRHLAAGPHTFTATCVGRDDRSRGYVIGLNTLEGDLVP